MKDSAQNKRLLGGVTNSARVVSPRGEGIR